MDNTQPSMSAPLQHFVFLVCQIEADFELTTENGSNAESRWFLPNGTIIPVNDEVNNRYDITQGPGVNSGYETILLIQPVTYSDAGTYLCEVRDIRDPDNIGPWMRDQATLTLRGKIKLIF